MKEMSAPEPVSEWDLAAAPRRGRFEGVSKVVRFNPWFFVGGFGALVLGGILLATVAWPPLLFWLGVGAMTVAGWLLIASLVATHWVYDRSGLFSWRWLQESIGGGTPETVVIAHSGFDEVSAAVRRILPRADCRVLDLHDAARMTEPSIARARKLYPPPPGTIGASATAWPVESGGTDLVLLLFAAHEWRHGAERIALLREAGRSLAPGGCVVLMEHVRDLANFLVYGPGALHFHAAGGWRRESTEAGLRIARESRLTPFVRIWNLTHDAT